MSELFKTERVTIRFTAQQIERLNRASAIESGRKAEIVEPGTLIREATMARVDEILAGTEALPG